ncbi:hypothetical protein H4219_003975 [Mycoemilia scoparia]|uniref:Glycosyl hydrolase n=1 Tax=Mycoemilia scoparia TaxID=417184 RepID=A0A9W8A194_9FUNG|nr:hypothetical protein H4219_003975 [Mycoemilia scoparia]
MSDNYKKFAAENLREIHNEEDVLNKQKQKESGSSGGQFHNIEERLRSATGYLPIESYGVIGNLHTVALVGQDGGMDFMCWPAFDSPSIFCRILDRKIGGHFSIVPSTNVTSKQQYMPSSNILATKFLSEDGVSQITDLMYRSDPNVRPRRVHLPWVIRYVEVIRGTVSFNVECFPAFDYARTAHTTEIKRGRRVDRLSTHAPLGRALSHHQKSDGLLPTYKHHQQVIFKEETRENGEEGLIMDLRCVVGGNEDGCPNFAWEVEEREGMKGPGVVTTFVLKEGARVAFILRDLDPEDIGAEVVSRKNTVFEEEPLMTNGETLISTGTVGAGGGPVTDSGSTAVADYMPSVPYHNSVSGTNPPITMDLIEDLIEDTVLFWFKWIQGSKYRGRWRETMERSALTLKLLTYEPTGAVVAAPTFSIPEHVGGTRNWDYRYVWIRDSAFTMYAFMRLGLTKEADHYMNFIDTLFRNRNKDGGLQIMYTIRGEKEIPETELNHLEGYRQSRPVRIGNGAADHLQLDIYGELMDSIYLYNKYSMPIGYDTWLQVRDLVDWVCNNYDRPDMGIWEVRGGQQHFTYSKFQCWVAIDRGIRLADKRDFPCLQREHWRETRDKLYEEIMQKSWNPDLGAFMLSYENQDMLDAAVLSMPLVFFINASDPRFMSTLQRILRTPEKGGLVVNNLVYRYNTVTFNDGVGNDEGSFSMCTFWLVEALTRAGEHHPIYLYKAQIIFQQMLSYSNHLSLFSEEIARTGEMLGNFPQAFTHISLISAAFNLDRTISKRK